LPFWFNFAEWIFTHLLPLKKNDEENISFRIIFFLSFRNKVRNDRIRTVKACFAQGLDSSVFRVCINP
jgi:hypothetical protein